MNDLVGLGKIVCTQPSVDMMLKVSQTPRYAVRRTHRTYTPQFKAELVAAYQQPGASVAAVALQHGMNTNVLHRWLKEWSQGLHRLDVGVTAALSTTHPTAHAKGQPHQRALAAPLETWRKLVLSHDRQLRSTWVHRTHTFFCWSSPR